MGGQVPRKACQGPRRHPRRPAHPPQWRARGLGLVGHIRATAEHPQLGLKEVPIQVPREVDGVPLRPAEFEVL